MVSGADGCRELVWIDFQDALLGRCVCDLVALLCDSYQTFDRAFLGAGLPTYPSEAGLSKDDHDKVLEEFDLVTVQRKLKDAGRFIYIDRVKKNPAFLPYVAPSLDKVRGALARLRHNDEDLRALEKIVF